MTQQGSIKTPADLLANQVRFALATAGVLKAYNVYSFDLSNARNDVLFPIAGDNLTVSALTGTASIRLTDITNDILPLYLGLALPRPTFFGKLLLTNAAQAGKSLVIVVGRDASFSINPPAARALLNTLGTQVNPATDDTLAKAVPILKGNPALNQVVLAATDIFAANLAPTNTPSTFRAFVSVDAAVKFQVKIVRGAASTVMDFNSGVNLVANALYLFDIVLAAGDTVNYRISGGATVKLLTVVEIGAGA